MNDEMKKEVEEAFLGAQLLVVRSLAERRHALKVRKQIISNYTKMLFEDEMPPKALKELEKLDDEISRLLLVENIVCYEILQLKKNAEGIIKSHD